MKMQQDLAKVDPSKVMAQRRVFNDSVAGLNDYSVQAVKAKTATQQWTESLIKQEMHIGQLSKSGKMFNDVLREQFQLQKMTAVQWTKNASGTMQADIIVPKGVDETVNRYTSSLKENVKALNPVKAGTAEFATALDVMKMRLGMANQVLGSVADNMVKWGKNTQWAGRQLTVGLTVPLIAFGALAGKLAYDVNQQLTRITKVYDFTTTGAAQAAEAQNLQTQSMAMGTQVAREYGKSLSETLSVEADLAATGLKGQDLLKSSAEVQRAATLGEMDYQSTIKATIALQSVYGESWKKTGGVAKNTADAFNYMNAIENATSLSMQDFVEAIPRAAGPLSQLGGTIQDMGVLLTAMKAAGVDAAIGANALKSSLGSLINPSSAALKTIKELTHGTVDLNKIVEESGGNYMEAMTKFSKAIAPLDNLQKQQIIEKLFGKQQYARIGGIITALGQVADKTTQVGRAFAVSQQTTIDWGNVAAGEMDKVRESASGKFRIAIESIKAQFASLGEPFLNAAASIVGGISHIMAAFNRLPSGMKTFLMWGVAIGAIAGPIIMLAGLLANLGGTVIKVFHFVGNLATELKAVTAEEAAAKMLAKDSTVAWMNQANSAKALAGQIAILTSQFEKLAAAQMDQRMASQIPGFAGFGTMPPVASPRIGTIGPAGPNVVPSPNGGVMRPGGQFASNAEISAYNAMLTNEHRLARDAEDHEKEMAKQTQTAEKSWGGIGAKVLKFGGILAATSIMFSGMGNGLVSNIANAVFLGSMIGPSILKGIKAAGVGTAIKGMAAAFGEGKAAGGIASGLKAALPIAGELGLTILRFAGPMGLLAGGLFTLIKIHGAMEDARKKQDELTNSAKSWADVLGFIYQEQGKVKDAQGNAVSSLDQQAAAFAKSNKAVAENLRGLAKQKDATEAVNAAIEEGVKARLHGADATQAQQVVQIALKVAGYKKNEIDDIMKEWVSTINWDSLSDVTNKHVQAIAAAWPNIIKNQLGQSNWESVWRGTMGGGALNSASKEAAKNAGKEFWNAWNQAGDGQQKLALFNNLRTQIDTQNNDIFAHLKNDMAKRFKELGVSTFDQLEEFLRDQSKMSQGDLAKKYGSRLQDLITASLNIDPKDLKGIDQAAAAEQGLVRAMASAAGISPEVVNHLHTVGGALMFLDQPLKTVTQAQKDYNNVATDGDEAWRHYTDSQKLAILNTYRRQAGLSDATSVEQGFGASVAASTAAIKAQTNAMGQNALTADDFSNATKTAMQGAQSAVMSQADSIWSSWASAQVDAIKTSSADLDRADKAAQKRVNNQIKASDHYYNSRIKKIQDQLRIEKDADALRQKMFEAEQTRLQRLAEMANSTIDFNVALNTGSLDEAAKIFNTMQSTQDTNALNDVNDAAGSASQKRQDALQAQIDALTAERDAHKATLQAELDAEKAAYDKRKTQRDADTQNAKDALQKQLANRKMYLDLELATIRANVPRNKREYDDQIAQIEGAYQKYGLNLKSYGNSWAGYIGTALQSNIATSAAALKDSVNWQGTANQIAGQFAEGAFGLTIDQWAKWINTGQMPKGGIHPKSKDITTQASNVQGGAETSRGAAIGIARHGGGPIGSKSHDPHFNLAGRSPNAPLWRDEVLMRAQVGEYVINKDAHAALGTEYLDHLNKGVIARHAGGPIGLSGAPYTALAAMMMGMLAGTMNKASQTAGGAAGGSMNVAGGAVNIGKAGQYGNIKLNKSQLANAGAIISVGEGMHASTRDLIVSIMTALQESGLNNLNYGDRDSLGLFQQRPSQGWGTPAEILNPRYAAHKFFAGLLSIKGRNNMPLTLEAQAVQRSAYPYAYAKWQNAATSIVNRIAGLPSMNVGGTVMYDNTIANLHKDEKVLTAPLSKSLETGINNLENGHGGDNYDVTIDLRGATIREDIDIEKAVYAALDKAQSKKGKSRKVTSD